MRTSSMPSCAQRELEADVAHHGRDDRVALAAGPRAAAGAPHISSTASPSTIAAAVIDEDRAVAVAVERHAHLAAALDDRRAPAARDASIRSRRLMLRPSGWLPMTTVSKPRLANSSGATRRRRAVGAVDGELEAARAPTLREAPRADDRDRRRRDRRRGTGAGVAGRARATTGRRRSPRPRARRAR